MGRKVQSGFNCHRLLSFILNYCNALEQMFLHLLFELSTISRDLKYFFNSFHGGKWVIGAPPAIMLG